MNLFIKTLILLTLFVFLSINSLNAQSKYLDSTRTTFSVYGALGVSEAAISTSIGGAYTLKGALDIGAQIGTVKATKNLNGDDYNSLVNKGTTGYFFSAQAYLYMLGQNRGNNINFGVSLGGSNISYDEADLSSFVAGFHLSRRETEDGLTSIVPSLELGFILVNELTDKNSGLTITSEPFFTGSVSFGISRKLKDSKIFFFEPGVTYDNETQSLGGGLVIGLIF